MDRWTDRWINDEWVDKWIHGRMGRHREKLEIHGWQLSGRQADIQECEWMDG